jgi:hypothetical protein
MTWDLGVVVRPAYAEKLYTCDHSGRDNTRIVIRGGVVGKIDCWLESGSQIGVIASASRAQDHIL